MSPPAGVAPRDPRARLLRELGVQRFRLRKREPAPADTAQLAPAAAGTTNTSTQASSAQASAVTPVTALCLYRPDGSGAPEGVAAVVWTQVLSWLARSPDQVRWVSNPDGDALELPAASQWTSPAGKRNLWQALKAMAPEH